MKRLAIVLVMMFCAAVFYAHPPRVTSVTFDPATRLLTVLFDHNIGGGDPTRHFVKEVDVSLNGVKNIVETFTSQESSASETVIFKVRAVKGDKITVTAFCSLVGSGTKDFIVP